jgi:HlyD family secretion protein
VTLKIDAFPWRRFGTLQGTLRSIGQASFAPQDQTSSGAPPPGTEPGTALHRGQITLDPAALAALPPGTALLPGMTLSADIKIGTRSVLDFFIDPLLRGLQESLREP